MITRKLINLFAAAAAILMTACSTAKEEKALDITGTWDLINIEATKCPHCTGDIPEE